MAKVPLRVLSLDGGGIRGLSSLYILQSIMKGVEATTGSKPCRPSDFFDLIAGTSTGGLIAVMLGILEMDVDECIKAYTEMAPKIFPTEGKLAKSWFGKATKAGFNQPRFPAEPLEEAIQSLVEGWRRRKANSAGDNEVASKSKIQEWRDTPMRYAAGKGCKVLVCATSENPRAYVRFRNYEAAVGDFRDDCPIWQACRATSAAPTFFPPMTIGTPPVQSTYVDGAVGNNNPIEAAIEEVGKIWGREHEIGCILSIGTGVPAMRDVGRSPWKLGKTFAKIATDTENTAERFQERMDYDQQVYFRFNVQNGLEVVSLEEWTQFGRVQEVTRAYTTKQRNVIDTCARQISNPSNTISLGRKPDWSVRHSVIPFLRDDAFVGRVAILKSLDEKLETVTRVALVGLGGVGKSQIAIEYGHRWLKERSKASVFWMQATSTARVQEDFSQIASELDIQGRHNTSANIPLMVSSWLSQQKNGPWLIILDNADDFGVLSSQTSQIDNFEDLARSRRSLLSYIPLVSHGRVLVTSRYRKTAVDIVSDHTAIVHVPGMSEDESLQLLKNKLLIDENGESDALKLIRRLERLPLAITQAGAYIRNIFGMTIYKFLEDFDRSEQDRTRLLRAEGFGDLRRDTDVPSSVITTWMLSFLQIRKDQPAAANLLSLMSCFHWHKIPDSLLRGSVEGMDLSFEEAITPLLDFSLVYAESNGMFFDMHRLVWIATRSWLGNDISRWNGIALKCTLSDFPTPDEPSQWMRYESILPHSEQLLASTSLTSSFKVTRAIIQRANGHYFNRRGFWTAAIRNLEPCLKVFLEEKDYEEALEVMNELAHSQTCSNNLPQAETILKQALTLSTERFGDEHSETLNTLAQLAHLYSISNQNRAKELCDRVFEAQARVLEEIQPNTPRILSWLAVTYTSLGELTRSQELCERAIKVYHLQVRDDHTGLLACQTHLARICSMKGDNIRARQLLEKIIATEEPVLGDDHLKTLEDMLLLTSILVRLGDLEEARDVEERALERRTRALGKDHPDSLASMQRLGSIYMDLDDNDRARSLFAQTLDIRRRRNGDDHIDTLTSARRLAVAYSHLGDNERARDLEEQALEKMKKNHGYNHLDTLSLMKELSMTYCDLDRQKDAIALAGEALQLARSELGNDHTMTRDIANFLDSVSRDATTGNKLEDGARLTRAHVRSTSSFGSKLRAVSRTMWRRRKNGSGSRALDDT